MAEHYLKQELYERVQTSPEIFEFLQGGSLDGIWYWDLVNPEHEWMSPRFWEAFGYDPATREHRSAEWQEMVHPEDLRVAIENFEKHCADPSHPYDQVVRYRHRDGSTVWVRCRGLAIRDESGRAIRMLGAHTDVTREKRAQERLHRSHRELRSRFEAVVQASGQLLYDRDLEAGAVSYENVQESLGYAAEELAGGLARWIELVHPEDREGLQRELARARETRGAFYLEYRIRRKDGEYLHVEDRGYPWNDSSGGPARLVGFVVDVSELKSLEEQLRQTQKMEAVGRLAGGIAHDFNNLLSVILGYSELILEELPAEERWRPELVQIRDAGDRAKALTRQLLAFSRRQVLQPSVLDLAAVIQRMEDLLRPLIGEDVNVRVVLAPDLGRVRFDPGQIEQIILNLAINARDAMPQGGRLSIEATNVELDEEYARTHADAQPGPHVMLAISDDGVGMDAATQARLFEPFFTTKKLGKGTGLGLSTVYGIVRQSGGNIWVYSEVGKGTTFKVYLPAVQEAVSPPAPSPRPAATPASGTILVVEDEDGVRELIRTVLAQAGYEVFAARDGREALELFESRASRAQLLLTDVVLPSMGGRRLAEVLTARKPALKVLYMSGYTDNAIVHHGVLDPGVAFLEKPISPRGLLEKLRATLSA